MKKFAIFVVVAAAVMAIGLPMLSANADSSEYKVYIKNPTRIDENSVCVPVSIYLQRPATQTWECAITLAGQGYYRTKIMEVFYSGPKGAVFSNDDVDKDNQKFCQLVPGRVYHAVLQWRKKGAEDFEYTAPNMMEITIPFPKIEFGKMEAKKQTDGSYCLKADMRNILDRGRIDWCFEVMYDSASCDRPDNCGFGSFKAEKPMLFLQASANYKIWRNGKQNCKFRVIGYDHARQEWIESSWYDFGA